LSAIAEVEAASSKVIGMTYLFNFKNSGMLCRASLNMNLLSIYIKLIKPNKHAKK